MSEDDDARHVVINVDIKAFTPNKSSNRKTFRSTPFHASCSPPSTPTADSPTAKSALADMRRKEILNAKISTASVNSARKLKVDEKLEAEKEKKASKTDEKLKGASKRRESLLKAQKDSAAANYIYAKEVHEGAIAAANRVAEEQREFIALKDEQATSRRAEKIEEVKAKAIIDIERVNLASHSQEMHIRQQKEELDSKLQLAAAAKLQALEAIKARAIATSDKVSVAQIIAQTNTYASLEKQEMRLEEAGTRRRQSIESTVARALESPAKVQIAREKRYRQESARRKSIDTKLEKAQANRETILGNKIKSAVKASERVEIAKKTLEMESELRRDSLERKIAAATDKKEDCLYMKQSRAKQTSERVSDVQEKLKSRKDRRSAAIEKKMASAEKSRKIQLEQTQQKANQFSSKVEVAHKNQQQRQQVLLEQFQNKLDRATNEREKFLLERTEKAVIDIRRVEEKRVTKEEATMAQQEQMELKMKNAQIARDQVLVNRQSTARRSEQKRQALEDRTTEKSAALLNDIEMKLEKASEQRDDFIEVIKSKATTSLEKVALGSNHLDRVQTENAEQLKVALELRAVKAQAQREALIAQRTDNARRSSTERVEKAHSKMNKKTETKRTELNAKLARAARSSASSKQHRANKASLEAEKVKLAAEQLKQKDESEAAFRSKLIDVKMHNASQHRNYMLEVTRSKASNQVKKVEQANLATEERTEELREAIETKLVVATENREANLSDIQAKAGISSHRINSIHDSQREMDTYLSETKLRILNDKLEQADASRASILSDRVAKAANISVRVQDVADSFQNYADQAREEIQRKMEHANGNRECMLAGIQSRASPTQRLDAARKRREKDHVVDSSMLDEKMIHAQLSRDAVIEERRTKAAQAGVRVAHAANVLLEHSHEEQQALAERIASKMDKAEKRRSGLLESAQKKSGESFQKAIDTANAVAEEDIENSRKGRTDIDHNLAMASERRQFELAKRASPQKSKPFSPRNQIE